MGVTTKEEAMKLTVPKLKEELGSRGLSQDGLKAVLLERLLTDIQRVDAESEEVAKAAEKEKAEEAAKEAEEAQAAEAAKVAEETQAAEAAEEAQAAKAAEEAKAEEAAKAAEEAKAEEAAKAAEEAKAEEAVKAADDAKAEEAITEEAITEEATTEEATTEDAKAEEATTEEAAKATEDAKAEEVAEAAEDAKAEEAAKTDENEPAQEAAEVAEEAKEQEDAGEDNKTDVKADAEAPNPQKTEDESVQEQDGTDEAQQPVTANGGRGAEAPEQAAEEKSEEPKAEADKMEESGESTQQDDASPADGDVKKDPMETDEADAETKAAAPKEAIETAKAEGDPDAITDTPAAEGEGGKADADGGGEAGGDQDGMGEGKDGPGSPTSVGADEPPSKKAKTSNGAATKKAKLTGDPSGREIFIDNIPESATDDEVKKLAEEKGGPVGSIRVIRSQPNLPNCKGMALVRFLDRDAAQKALEDIPKDKLGDNELSARASSNANTLFIGNLNKLWTKEQVLKAFAEEVEGVVNFEVTMDALNRNHNRGFGFATFDTVESCKAAHAKYYKDKLKIMDNPVLIDWAETRGNKEDDERGVYILNVDENVEDEAFKANFAKFGTIEKIVYGRLIPHARRKDFAIINFSTRQAAKACIQEMNGSKFMGKELEITMAKAKRKRDFMPYQERYTTGGRGGGPRNFGAGGGGAQGHRAPMYSGGYGGRGQGRGGVMYPRPTGGRGFVGGPGIPVAGVPGVAPMPGVPGVPAGGFGGPYMAGGAAGRGGYVQPQYQAYQPSGQTYIAGGQAVYQPAPMVYAPAQAYPQPYGAQPVVPQPYLSGGSNSAAPQPWQPPRQF